MASSVIFAKTEILKVLSLIDTNYQVAYAVHTNNNIRLMKIYSYSAVITFSGWLEDGMDGVVGLTLSGLSSGSQTRLLGRVKWVNGASYDHFVRRLEVAYGSHGVEYIESFIGSSDKAILESTLGLIKNLRNDASHSYRAVITRNPSQIITEFNRVYPILKKIEKASREYRDLHF